MKIDLKCFSKLASRNTCDYKDSTPYDLAEGQTVEDLINLLGFPEKT